MAAIAIEFISITV